jgi:hypothetical protein
MPCPRGAVHCQRRAGRARLRMGWRVAKANRALSRFWRAVLGGGRPCGGDGGGRNHIQQQRGVCGREWIAPTSVYTGHNTLLQADVRFLVYMNVLFEGRVS